MSQSFDIAVIGATGTVGETIVQILEERDFPIGELYLLASAESAGNSVPYRGKNLRVREVDAFDFNKVQIAFFAAGPAATRSYAMRATAAGCAVIDLAGGLPVEQAPNVVPEVNAAVLANQAKPYQVACPSPCATALAMVLAPLKAMLEVQRVSVTACLAVSSRGREGVTELARQTAELLNVRPLEPRVFDRQMAFNVLAQVDTPDAQGHAELEKRLATELRELLSLPLIKVGVTCIQVPVFFGDSLSVSVQTASPVDLAAIGAALDATDGVEWVEGGDYPTPVGDAVGQDAVYVGRLRGGIDDACELNFWVTSDNVRKGAALNAVQVAELLIKDVV